METESGFIIYFIKYLYTDLLVEIISQVQGCVNRSKVLLETSLGRCKRTATTQGSLSEGQWWDQSRVTRRCRPAESL